MQVHIEEAPRPEVTGQATGEDYWRALATARTAEQLCRAWLPILCGMVPGTHAGLLLFKDSDESFAPVALYPETADLAYLGDIAGEALGKREGVVRNVSAGLVQVAYPMMVGEQIQGGVVLELAPVNDTSVTQAMRLTHWGVGWLIDLFNRRRLTQVDRRLDQSAFLFELALGALAEEDFRKSALTAVNLLAKRFDCHQVQMGRESAKSVRIVAVSHSAWFDDKTNRMNLAAQAMNEALDQRARIVLPDPGQGVALTTSEHRRYAEESGAPALCSQPLLAGHRVMGVWLLERDEAFSPEELDTLETLSLVLGPILDLKQTAEQGLVAHGAQSWRGALRKVTDSSHPGMKLLALVIIATFVFLSVFKVDYRVASTAHVEGEVQRVAAAPFQGYVRTAAVRAGDVVRKGQVLATLEDQDLKLERLRWESEMEVAQRKEREAMAKADRVTLRMAAAQANQARAQLDLALEKLDRVQILAPFDGVVVRGDLSQKLGAPVEQGEVLFELAPLDAWRVILKVDERDIAQVQEGRPGLLVLASLPGQRFPFMVKKVTPVSIPEEGRNYFRVEAALTGDAPKLRPGMEGVAKVEAGERTLMWTWTHRLTEWLRLAAWKWLP